MLELTFDEEVTPTGNVEMNDNDYHSHEAVSASMLKRLVMNDEVYEVANGIKTETTAAMVLGSVIHCLILEPHKFSEEYAVMPKCDLRTKDGKAMKAAFEEMANEKTVITESDYETALQCVEAFKDSGVSSLFETGLPEQKFFSYFDDVHVRGMLDWYDQNVGRILDIKTTQNYADTFVKECGDRGYFIQAAFYIDLLRSLGLPAKDFLFIGIQSKAPFKVTVVSLNPIDIEDGREAYRIGIDIWRDIKANPDKFKSRLCVNPSDGSAVFEYATPMWLRYKLDKLKKQGA